MPNLVFIRLSPVEPLSGAAFSSYLANLSVKVYDLSFGDGNVGTLLGESVGAWSPPSADPTDPKLHDFSPGNPRIFQHYSIIPTGFIFPAFKVQVEAVATAVIVVDPAIAGHPEYPNATAFDLRLEVTNNGHAVLDKRLDFNVPVVAVGGLSVDPSFYIDPAQPTAAFLALADPAQGLAAGMANIELPEDGSPPKFDTVFAAVNAVLAQDPGGGGSLDTLSPLTAAQALQVAREVVNNRSLHPVPATPRRLEEMYSRPAFDNHGHEITGQDLTFADLDRKQFEASLKGYYAVQEANAGQIAKYVFAASAAVWAEKQTHPALARAVLEFPVDPASAGGAKLTEAEVVLLPAGGFTLDFQVPASCFYALGAALAPAAAAEQRFRLATLGDEPQIAAELRQAIDTGVISAPARSPENLARRLVAIGKAVGVNLPVCPLDTDLDALVTDWLAFPGADISAFWAANVGPHAAGHLDLVLSAITRETDDPTPKALVAAIKAIPVHNVGDLRALTAAAWESFFLPGRVGLLPPFTVPGTPEERVAAFVRQVRKYLDMAGTFGSTAPASATLVTSLDVGADDPLAAFIARYDAVAPAPFAFGATPDSTSLNLAVEAVFPDEPGAQAWLRETLAIIADLITLTTGLDPVLNFSLLEALYARGLTSVDSVKTGSLADLERALTGTVTYPFAGTIYTNAGGTGGPSPSGPGSFRPVNPDGSLVNCVPPCHLSPLGPVQYLHEMLDVSGDSSCDAPFPGAGDVLGALLAPRRGPLGDLLATSSNAQVPLPLIDLVNENLEALASGSSSGVIYQTNRDELAGHALRPASSSCECPPQGPGPFKHDPAVLFAAVPEHSSPATPVDRPDGYDKLRLDFTAPGLPYSQPLDVLRSYLKALGTSRFATMRTFREKITEFAPDPALEAVDFQSHLWRYPVRVDIAREYVGISPDEHQLLYTEDIVTTPQAGHLLLRELYGFPADQEGGVDWHAIVAIVPEFLHRTGLTYCEFLELQKSEFVKFRRRGKEGPEAIFPACEPCCAEDMVIRWVDPSDADTALKELAVFIRLWRTLRGVPGMGYSFRQLAAVAEGLKLFNGDTINPDFVRQIAAFQMLREEYGLSLGEVVDPSVTAGPARLRILGLWDAGSADKDWAVDHLLDRIEDNAEAWHARHYGGGRHCSPEFMKVVRENLDALSSLAGFRPDAGAKWDGFPSTTLRFAEVISKVYLSDFNTGELLFLFNTDVHLDGEDIFPQQDANEALDLPLDLPEDARPFRLWDLREKVLGVRVPEEAAERWTWPLIEGSLREEFAYVPPVAGADPLRSLGEHFFPEMLSTTGTPVSMLQRQYRSPLAVTRPGMWHTPPHGTFAYDPSAKELYAQLPLRDGAVAEKLCHLDQLSDEEQKALREVYSAPRADLAPFALLFEDFTEAEHRLIEEENEFERWRYFQRSFALFHARCCAIAEHLAAHVAGVTDRCDPPPVDVAWEVLRRLLADEDRAASPWENDAGTPPTDILWPLPTGGAFAALLGLAGTGLLGEFRAHGALVWDEVRGPLSAFGKDRNHWNTPFPTILPALDVKLTPPQLRFATVRNGMAVRNSDGECLGGVEGFEASWSGVLLIHEPGSYVFHTSPPHHHGEPHHHEHHDQGEPHQHGGPQYGESHRHDHEPHDHQDEPHRHEHRRWRLTLRRGQRTWFLLNHGWSGEAAPGHDSEPLSLKRGAYFIKVEYAQDGVTFEEAPDACPRHTGFEVLYRGPDTCDERRVIPNHNLFRDKKDRNLKIDRDLTASESSYLTSHYTSTLRDIRRTYQRAFKALLFAHRLQLSAEKLPRYIKSELGYLLDHPAAFLGTSYVPGGGGSTYTPHHASLDFDFLPIGDPYLPPDPSKDERAKPSLQRRQALFDWSERLYDYTVMRHEVRERSGRPAWALFYEAENHQLIDDAELLVYLGIDVHHATAVLRFDQGGVVGWADLTDERWSLRVWHADLWVRRLLKSFVPLDIAEARPDLWAALYSSDEAQGAANLTKFYRDGCIERGEPRRYEDVKRLNDGLRVRARASLLAFLCGMDRVPLPWGTSLHAEGPEDLADLLLMDVEAGLCERVTRIEEGAIAVRAFVERARLGMEESLDVTEAFSAFWDARFSTMRAWQACRRRELYRENVIEWDDLEKARGSESYRFLESELRRGVLTEAVPGGSVHWPGDKSPANRPLVASQHHEPSRLAHVKQPENLGLMGRPDRDARRTWLAPWPGEDSRVAPPLPPRRPALALAGRAVANVGVFAGAERLPLWIQSAIRLGTRFLRLAAAASPPASSGYAPRDVGRGACCCQCGRVHPPVMDEYYFWLVDSRHFDAPVQDADSGATSADPTSDWERADKLPGLLYWPSGRMVRLAWARVHNGEIQAPRRSDDGVPIADGADPEIDFLGRVGDSLRFSVSGAVPIPPGHSDPSARGFRYDIAADVAVVLPEVVAAPAPPAAPGGLAAFPFFAYAEPGAPLESLLLPAAMAIAGALRTRCRYESALKWYEIPFTPLAEDCRWSRCRDRDVPPPAGDPNGPPPAHPPALTADPDRLATGRRWRRRAAAPAPKEAGGEAVSVRSLREVRALNPCCETEVATDEVVRQRSVLLHYLETLAQYADAVMARSSSSEGFQKARLLVETMARVLGPRPATILVEDDGQSPQSVADFVPQFAPLNPRLMDLYHRVEDHLGLIAGCLTVRRLPASSAGCGPSACDLPPANQAEMRPCDRDDDCCGPSSPYRFQLLVQKAQEVAAEVRTLGAEVLAAFEKGDAEYLASLRAAHEGQLTNLLLEVRQNEWRESDWQLQSLKKTKEGTQARRQYFADLIAAGLISHENAYISLTQTSMVTRVAGNVVEAVGQAMNLIPDPTVGAAGFGGTPVSILGLPVGTKLGFAFAAAARILFTVADIAVTSAGMDLTEAGWDRRQQDWVEQVTELDIQIEQIQRLILGAERRRDGTLRALNNLQQQREQEAELLDFLRDKFTNHALYLHHQQEAAALHRRMYDVALCWARQAQRAFHRERGDAPRDFLPDRPWDDLHEGLLSGERLGLALRQMEKSYLDLNVREYELVKHISLRLHAPLAFLRLKAGGACEFDLPEWLYDLDHPGHYMRRIKTVGLTVQGVSGPYSGVHCRLVHLCGATRVAPDLRPVERCCHDDRECCPDCAPALGYKAGFDDPRIVRQYGRPEAIATSTGVNDSGLFEVNLRDERYLPFEYSGAVCRLSLEMPPSGNAFDLETVSDVVLHVSYTAREGGDALRRAANASAECCLPGGGLRFFDARQDFSDEWQRLRGQLECGHPHPAFDLRLGPAMFPFLSGHRRARVVGLDLFFEAPDASPGASVSVALVPPRHRDHGHGTGCDCVIPEFPCVASADYPCLYHGTVKPSIDYLKPHDLTEMGSFVFPHGVGPVHSLYILCRYEATEPRPCRDVPANSRGPRVSLGRREGGRGA